MKIWVDADACPTVMREILCKAAERVKLPLIFVANQRVPVPSSEWISAVQVPAGFDVADNEIVRRVSAGDLVITSDIPLADEVITQGALALNTRGELYTADSIKARLNMRDFMDTMRSSGVHTGGPAALSQADRREFSNQLDRILTRYRRQHPVNADSQ
ncbi:YaiI/YqxD family protein [Marinospirillum sp.]|uniref:YaiI/YqxD family protein n=1 Tax=Marinospirillum sp. TaxID=2183934 RepID=UPI003A83A96C